ncbi:MAG: glycosyltransferase family 2 protein [Prevotella sp.]|nr:glycosyltransferase family 2 protein [Prevotella sp.]
MLVSIIIPVYNVERYLHECIQSIVNQTFTDWECILVDDGSTDGSGKICDQFSKQDHRISVIHKENQGVSAARNEGLEHAQGEWINFIDADDWVEETYLSQMIDESKNKKYDLVVSGSSHDYPDGKSYSYGFSSHQEIGMDKFHTQNFIDHIGLFYGPCAKLFKQSIIHEYNIIFPVDYSLGEDLLFNFKYLDHIDYAIGIPNIGYHYRRHQRDTLTCQFRENLFDIKLFQWRAQKSFLERRDMWDKHAQKHFFTQLWGIIYDGIFLYPKLRDKKTSYIKSILSIPEIDNLKAYQHCFHCSSWIKCMILHRQSFAFKMYFHLPFSHHT